MKNQETFANVAREWGYVWERLSPPAISIEGTSLTDDGKDRYGQIHLSVSSAASMWQSNTLATLEFDLWLESDPFQTHGDYFRWDPRATTDPERCMSTTLTIEGDPKALQQRAEKINFPLPEGTTKFQASAELTWNELCGLFPVARWMLLCFLNAAGVLHGVTILPAAEGAK